MIFSELDLFIIKFALGILLFEINGLIIALIIYNIYEMINKFNGGAYFPNTITINGITYIKDKEEKLVNSEKAADKRISELLKENEELKEELQYYKNTKAIQKSNDTSRWKPGCMSYVDRELNHF